MTQIHTADKAGIGLTTLKKIERGEYNRVEFGLVKKYVNACGEKIEIN